MRGLCLLLCLFVTVQSERDYGWHSPGGLELPPNDPTDCLSDTTSCGCCLMKKQMHRMEDYFNKSLDLLQESVNKAQTTLTNIRTSRSAFSVALTDKRKCVGPLRYDYTVKYEVIFINMDNRYIPSNGTFIAPRSGVYVLALTVYSDSGAPGSELHACANLRVNGIDVVKIDDSNIYDQEDSGSAVLVYKLNSGDTVSVFLPMGCTLCGDSSHYNTFSGFLLYATG